ncbi:hypothetical protein [Pseudoalteromonas rubra]|uniref:Uncharacterized protein n=1 Tax=Pseudoalteromonas rubra TaxID=43658 RepID=A0A0F4QFJ7_9GAMM|nr:hypothetical protein [Pseudoalteromonas rubra]KJZ05452.1 hypothetical protein TW77_22745 [Pseudoalteromonas rubra]
MKKTIFALFAILFSNNLLASDFTGRKLTGAAVYNHDGKSILFITINDTNQMAACAYTKRFAIDSTAANFQEMVSIAMMAYATGDAVHIKGIKDSCNYWDNAQDLKGIAVGSIPF